MSKDLHLYIQKGTDFHVHLEVLENNEPMDLNNATASMKVKADYDKETIIDFSTENQRIIINATESTIDLKLPKEETSALYFKEAFYDLLITNNLGDTFLLIKGKVFLQKTVSND